MLALRIFLGVALFIVIGYEVCDRCGLNTKYEEFDLWEDEE